MTHRTLLTLAPDHVMTRKIVADAHAAHQVVMSGFHHLLPKESVTVEGGHARNRADLGILFARQQLPGGGIQLLIQSSQPGKWDSSEWSEALDSEPKEGSPTLPTSGTIRYQLTCNPTWRDAASRKLHAFRRVEDILSWWKARAARCGLSLVGEPELLRTEALSSATRRLNLETATLAGVARVGDAEALQSAIREGVGRGRAYGCGLLVTQGGVGK